MRNDSLGMFWEDLPPEPKVKKDTKRVPPEPVWLEPDFLPYLEEARTFNVSLYTDEELVNLAEPLVFDIECNPNYFLCAFRGVRSKKVVYFESLNNSAFDVKKLRWLVETKLIVGFNSRKYDIIILAIALNGFANESLWEATEKIIRYDNLPWDVLRDFKTREIVCNHIDLIEVAPLFGSLKIYGGRLHCQRMQDLPFAVGSLLTADQALITRWYCINDLDITMVLLNKLEPELSLREDMSAEFNVDLRSKSDAQIAEAVIGATLKKLQGAKPSVPGTQVGREYRYNVPEYMETCQSDLMRWVVNQIRVMDFVVGPNGAIGAPPELSDMDLHIGDSVYKLGVGGLHSSEKSACHIAENGYLLEDRDVTSYYPIIILNQGLYPSHLGTDYLAVYRSIVNRRLEAKAEGNKVVADSLKITINGTFGKHGSMHSIVYSPDLVIQITITGQLSLLLLIERLELAGIRVVSANTDGVVINPHKDQKMLMDGIVEQWERDTGFNTEGTRYKGLYSRDVNNYIAVKEGGGTKTKGIFAKAGLSKNPQSTIVVTAIAEFLENGISVEQTINACSDLTAFLTVRTVKGGAVKDSDYLGKAIRWYKSNEVEGEIVYASSGNKVPLSENARPCMNLPSEFPADVDHLWYIEQAEKVLKQIGVKEFE